MPSTPADQLGHYIGRAEALENVLDAVLPLLTPEQKEALATAVTALTLDPPEDTPHNWQHDPEYSVSLEGAYQTLLVELWRG